MKQIARRLGLVVFVAAMAAFGAHALFASPRPCCEECHYGIAECQASCGADQQCFDQCMEEGAICAHSCVTCGYNCGFCTRDDECNAPWFCNEATGCCEYAS